jgi:hypothetical protein
MRDLIPRLARITSIHEQMIVDMLLLQILFGFLFLMQLLLCSLLVALITFASLIVEVPSHPMITRPHQHQFSRDEYVHQAIMAIILVNINKLLASYL